MKLYNSITKKVEIFTPINPGKVTMYVCGPTVYGHAHIGNARPPLVFDYLHRSLKFLGFDVKYVANITDIDDKIINKAIDEGVSEREIANRYADIYNYDLRRLNVLEYTFQPRVIDSMDAIVAFIAKLVEIGVAYVTEDRNVYFSTEKVAEYESFVGQNLEQLNIGERIAKEASKRGDFDFVLWKPTEVGVKFTSPWGEGRPGWHTECVVMIEDYFHGKIDIHGGGQDLRFPHHSNEMAQAQALYNHSLANVWMHTGMININQNKMSKSLGNIVRINESLEKYSSDAIRYWMYSTNYRHELTYSDEILENATKSVHRLHQAYDTALIKRGVVENLEIIAHNEHLEYFDYYREQLVTMIENDLSTANVLSLMQEIAKLLNNDQNVELLRLMKTIGYLCGFRFVEKNMTSEVMDLINERDLAKSNRNYTQADILREQLLNINWLIR